MVDRGVKDCVQVDAHEVLKVGRVGGRHRVHGLVREGEGVQEGLHGRLEQVDERLLHGIGLRAAEHGMLDDMEDPGVVRRRRLEGDREGLVGVGARDPHRPSARRLVAQHVDGAGDLGDGGCGDHLEACVHAAGGKGWFGLEEIALGCRRDVLRCHGSSSRLRVSSSGASARLLSQPPIPMF